MPRKVSPEAATRNATAAASRPVVADSVLARADASVVTDGRALAGRLGEETAIGAGYQGRLALVQWVSVSRSSILLTWRGGVANVA